MLKNQLLFGRVVARWTTRRRVVRGNSGGERGRGGRGRTRQVWEVGCRRGNRLVLTCNATMEDLRIQFFQIFEFESELGSFLR